MLNISSIKELLYQPSEIQWNIAGTLLGKQERKISWALSYKICPKIIKMGEIAILWGTLGTWEPMWNSIVFMILWISESFSLYLLVKNSFNFKLGFFTYFEYLLGGASLEKTFWIHVTIVSGDIDAKKTRKASKKLHIKFFPNASLGVLCCYKQLWLKMFVKKG